MALVFDTSLSMGYKEKDKTRLDEAKERAGEILKKTPDTSQVFVVDSAEPAFRFDREGHVAEVGQSVQTESHRLIEHLMIAANEAVARLLSDRGIPALYRVHERPQPLGVRRCRCIPPRDEFRLISPPVRRRPLGSRPSSASAVVVLPQPDSPARPSASPRRSEKLTPSTIGTTLPASR